MQKILTLIVIATLAFSTGALWQYSTARAKAKAVAAEHQRFQTKKALELVRLERELEASLREAKTVIQRSIDPAGCLDAPVPADIHRLLDTARRQE